MLAIERRNQILSILREEKRVVVSEIAKKFDVSEETIRRDLDKLEKEGQVVKTYGGAVLNENTFSDLPFIIRKNKNVERKRKIAEIAARLISDGDTIILDASSTAVFIAKAIKEKKHITLITNSIEVLIELSDVEGWKILSTGGALRENSLALVGIQAEDMLSCFHVNKAIVSCKGIDPERGFSDSSDMHASIKRKMLDCASQRIVAVDASKFDSLSFTQISDFGGVDAVITDEKPDARWQQIFAANDVDCLYGEE